MKRCSLLPVLLAWVVLLLAPIDAALGEESAKRSKEKRFQGGAVGGALHFLFPDLSSVNEVNDALDPPLPLFSDAPVWNLELFGEIYVTRRLKLGVSLFRWRKETPQQRTVVSIEGQEVEAGFHRLRLRTRTAGIYFEWLHPWEDYEFSLGFLTGVMRIFLVEIDGAAVPLSEVFGGVPQEDRSPDEPPRTIESVDPSRHFSGDVIAATTLLFRPYLAVRYKVAPWFAFDLRGGYQFGDETDEFYTQSEQRISDMPKVGISGVYASLNVVFGVFP